MLTLYRRHTKKCVEELKKSGFSGDMRGKIDCKQQCTIWITGTTGGVRVPRQSTGTSSWSEALAIKREQEEAGQVRGASTMILAQAVELWLSECRRVGRSDCTLKAYATGSDKLVRYMEGQGKGIVNDVSRAVALSFSATLSHLSPKTQNLTRSILASLYGFLVRAGMADENPFRWVRSVRGERVMTDPLPEEDIAKLVAAAEPRLACLIELMSETGMRKSDALSFDPSKCEWSGKMWRYSELQIKSRSPMACFVSDGLMERIRGVAWLGSRPFIRDGDDPISAGRRLWDVLRRLGRRIGVENVHPHRLRDSFAVRMLLKGVPIYEVSKLLGHSSVKNTERYYAKWTPKRLDRLERLVVDASAEDPLGNGIRDAESLASTGAY
jgi:integrase/recombinase XerD